MRIGHLNDKEVEVRVPWQVVRRNPYHLDWALRLDGDLGVCTFEAVGADCGNGTDHAECGLCYCCVGAGAGNSNGCAARSGEKRRAHYRADRLDSLRVYILLP
jgi:hypothetical protein